MISTANHTPLLLPAAMLALGIAATQWLEGSVGTWLAALSVAVVAVFLCFRWGKVCSLCILTAIFLFGALRSQQTKDGQRIALPKEKVAYEAVLMSEPVERGKVVRFDLAVLTGGSPILTKASLLRDTLTQRHLRLHVGDGIRAFSYLEEPSNFYQSDFDYARWLRLHGFAAETFLLPADWQKARVQLKPLGRWNRAVLQARKARQAVLQRYQQLHISGNEAAIVAALSLGDKSLLSDTVKDDYSRAGVAHLLALSGLHLGILCSLFSLFGRGRSRRKWLPSVLTMITVWAFAFLTGLSSSVVRAAIMLSLYALMQLLGRDRQPTNTLMATIIIMLVVHPPLIYDLGFQLSVLAVWSIQLFLPLLSSPIPHDQDSKTRRMVHALWSFVCLSVVAQLGTAPLVAHIFGRFPTYFLLANLLAVPFATLLLYLVVLLLLATPLPMVQEWVAQGVVWTAKTLNGALQWIANLPGASVEGLHLNALQTVLCYVLIVILWCFFSRIHLVRKQAKDIYED